MLKKILALSLLLCLICSSASAAIYDCGDADAFFTDAEMKVVSSSPEYEPRFKIVEIIESIKAKLKE